jgi:sialic acid synthase SpsE
MRSSFRSALSTSFYTAQELAAPRESPFGTTNGDLKRALEFGLDEFKEIDAYCKAAKMTWFASCWDEQSVDFMKKFDMPCFKIASASLTDDQSAPLYAGDWQASDPFYGHEHAS